MTSLLTRPTPAAAAQASQVLVRAHGTSGAEELALRINGEEVARWGVSTTPDDYVFTTDQPIEVTTVEVTFLNDTGMDRDLVIDHVDVGGIVLQSESPSTMSTGSFVDGEGCRERASVSETLHCRGSFTYDVPTGSAPTDTPIVIAPNPCLLYTSPSPRDRQKSRMPSSA